MNKILKMVLFLVVLGIVCSGLLAGINLLTKARIEENKNREETKVYESFGLDNISPLEVSNLKPGQKVFTANQKDTNVECYLIQTNQTNSYTTFAVIVVIAKDSKEILNIGVTDSPYTTHNYDRYFEDNDFGVIGATDSNYNNGFENISGATISSNSVKNGIKDAYDIFSNL